jgi:predicted HTH transcriptional regulator
LHKLRIKEIISKEESQWLEFKAMINLEQDSQKKEIAKDFIAMANAEGGIIVIGYNEKAKMLSVCQKNGMKKDFSRLLVNVLIHLFFFRADSFHIKAKFLLFLRFLKVS